MEWTCSVHSRGVNGNSGRVKTEAECCNLKEELIIVVENRPLSLRAGSYKWEGEWNHNGWGQWQILESTTWLAAQMISHQLPLTQSSKMKISTFLELECCFFLYWNASGWRISNKKKYNNKIKKIKKSLPLLPTNQEFGLDFQCLELITVLWNFFQCIKLYIESISRILVHFIVCVICVTLYKYLWLSIYSFKLCDHNTAKDKVVLNNY